MATAALVLGILSVLLPPVLDAGFLAAAPLAIVAMVLGLVGRRKPTNVGDLQTGSRWTANAGVVLGAVGLLVSAYWWIPFIRTEMVLVRLARPATRYDVSTLAKQVGSGGGQGDVVEVAGVVAGNQHMPGHGTVALRSAATTQDNWRVICEPLGGRLPNPEPSDGQTVVVRGRIKQVDTDVAIVFGRQIRLAPCVLLTDDSGR